MGINPIIPTYPQVGRKESRRGWVRRRKIENNRWIRWQKDIKKMFRDFKRYKWWCTLFVMYSLCHGDIPNPGKSRGYTPDEGGG